MTARHSGLVGFRGRASCGAVGGLSSTAKLLGLVVFVVSVALTPRTAVWAFGLDAIVAVVVIAIANIGARVMIARLAVLLPFVAFAFVLPIIGRGARTAIGPLSLSVDGLWSAWGIIAKATLGTAASIVFATTTPIPEVIAALGRLRVPTVIVAIVSFFLRYLDLLADRFARMRQAMMARGHDPRWLWQARPIAQSAGTLFVRTYERGERVHQAMLARGFVGTMPVLDERVEPRRDFAIALVPGLVAAGAAVSSVIVGA